MENLQKISKTYSQQGISLREAAEKQEVTDVIQVENASNFLKEVKVSIRSIEEKRKSFTDPLNQSLNEINSTFKDLKAPFELAKQILDKKISSWHLAEEKRVREENEKIRAEELRRQKIQESHKKKGHQVKEEIYLPQVAKTPNKIGGAHMRKVWTFDEVDLSKVPDSFKMLDRTKVNEAIRAGRRDIPGLKIYQKSSMV